MYKNNRRCQCYVHREYPFDVSEVTQRNLQIAAGIIQDVCFESPYDELDIH